MEEIRVTDVPYMEALEHLRRMGFEYISTPISWRYTYNYQADLPECIKHQPVTVMSLDAEGSVGIWPWKNGNAVYSDQPLAVLRKTTPEGGVGVYTNISLTCREFGDPSHFISCTVHRIGQVDAQPILTVWEPTPRAASAIIPDGWCIESEEDFTEQIREMCWLWLDEDFTIVWNPDTQDHMAETVLKSQRTN